MPRRDKSEQPTRITMQLPVVLVIEDDDAIRKVLTRTLRSWGCLVDGAATAAAGCAQAEGLQPDVILTDLSLGDQDGPALIGRLRALCPDARLVVVSGAEAPELPEGVDFVQKPFDPVALVQRVKRHLGRAGHSKPPTLPTPVRRASKRARPPALPWVRVDRTTAPERPVPRRRRKSDS